MTGTSECGDRGSGERFRTVRDRTEALAAPLSPEDQTVQSMPDVSPTKWHRAHTSWFFEAFLLRPERAGYRDFDPEFAYLFNSYYEGQGERHPRAQRGLLSRPSADCIAEYRAHVDEQMGEWFEVGVDPGLAALVELGLNHEQQHQELLLMDIKHVLGVNPLRPVYRSATVHPAAPRALGWTPHEGGLVDIGHAGDGFAYDNESPRHRVHLDPFRLADRPVTCGEWLAFMADDGYRRVDLWLSDGWATVQDEGWEAPLYWQRDGDAWAVHTLHGVRPVDPHRPVAHVSHYEADAYARWAGARLPTEHEWEAVVTQGVVTGPTIAAGARVEPVADLEPTMPSPIDDALAVGQVWEWTASPYLPYSGFRPAAGAVGEYNGKFMVNQQVLRGGCSVTPPGHSRPSYRNFFPSASRWAFAGVRLADDA